MKNEYYQHNKGVFITAKLRGFTLVELLVVISIIALLMALLMPALAAVQKHAKSVICQSRLRQWGLYYAMYTEDVTGGFFSKTKNATSSSNEWMAILDYYNGEPAKLLFCPIAVVPGPDKNGSTFSAYLANNEPLGSYGINRWIFSATADANDHSVFQLRYLWGSPLIRGAYRVPLLIDSAHDGGQPLHTDEPPRFKDDRDWWINDNQIRRFCLDRHTRNTVNAVFFDWTVRSIGLKELWTLKWHRGFDKCNEWTMCGGATSQKWADYGNGWMRDFKGF